MSGASFAHARPSAMGGGVRGARAGGGHPPLSRGRQLEAAVDSLSAWYFEYDEPKSGWHNERIHPLPEESSGYEPQDDDATASMLLVASSASTATTVSSSSSSVSSVSAPVKKNVPTTKPLSLREKELGVAPYGTMRSNNQDDEQEEDEAKPPSLVVQTSDGSVDTPSHKQQQQLHVLPRSRGSSDQRSSWGTRATTVASTASLSQNDLVVSGWTIRGSEKKVMYHIDVRASESQLQTYTIRRSYTDFKHLHSNLSDILEARREHYMQRKAVAAASAASVPGASGNRHSLHEKDKSLFSRTSFETTRHNNNNRRTSLEFDAAQAAAITDDLNEAWYLTFTLPPLPNAGFLSYWKRHDRTHLQNRCEMFQEILRAANLHPDLRECYAMQSFLSIAPCAIRERGSSYVSLCEYSVPRLDLEEETRERKKLARERRRNSSAHPTIASE